MALLLTACGASQYISQRYVDEIDQISTVLANHYPQLYQYYLEGVMEVTYLKEVELQDGTFDYKLKYKFTRYYFNTYEEKIEALRTYYPQIYQMYISGAIVIRSIYKYVDKYTGEICCHVSWSSIYDYYYYPRYSTDPRYYYWHYSRPGIIVRPAPRNGHKIQDNRPGESHVTGHTTHSERVTGEQQRTSGGSRATGGSSTSRRR